jgi:outer membrane protein assembly factor BamD
MDDVLVGLGDAYEAEANMVRAMRLPEAGKARLEKIYDDQAYAAYSKVVLEHSAAPHVEDARDRIAAMGLPVPTPTAEQVAASAALENSRGQYTLSKRATVVILRQADTVPAATIGAPPLEDAKPTNAAMVMNQAIADLNNSMNPSAGAQRAAAPLTPDAPATEAGASAPAMAPAASAPLAFQDVPSGTAGGDSGSTAVVTSVPTAAPAAGGSSMGLEIVQPSSGSGSTEPVTAPATPPAFPGTANAAPAAVMPASDPAQANDANGGLKPVGPPDATPLPPIEKAAAAPDAINVATPGSQPPAQAAPADGRKAKPAFDKSDESSSKHKKKKGLAKLNPF